MARRRFVLSEWKKEREEAGAIDIEVDSGEVFTIPPAELWPDSVRLATNDVEYAVAILGGQERYDAFLAGGGNAAMLNAMFAEANDGASPGESPAS
jgi:hypothetical protein